MKRARKLLKWARSNLRWILTALAALGIIVGGAVDHWNYRARMKAQVESHKAAIMEREKTIKELEQREVEKVTETVTVEVYDEKTGKLLKRTTMELAKVTEKYEKLLKERGRVPKLSLPGQQEAGYYPLGGFVVSSPEGELGGGLKWRLVPRLSLPGIPDPALTLAAGYHRDAFLGLVLVDVHRR